MFSSIGWGEIVVIVLAALFIFGPERLPRLASDAAAVLKRVRAAMRDVRGQLDDALGEDIADLRRYDLGQYHPKRFIREQLFGGIDAVSSSGGSAGPAEGNDGATIEAERRVDL